MRNVTLANIKNTEFRANPDFELLLFDRLPPDQQVLLQNLRNDPDFYGVLRPREGTGLGLKSVCRETALLFLTLQIPGPLPCYVYAQPGGQWHEAIVQMVLDGILQVKQEGVFISGAEAHGLFYDGVPGINANNAVAKLSIDALQYAQALPLDDVRGVSQRLYAYNCLPLTPSWKRQYPASDAVIKYLGIQHRGPNRRLLEAHWMAIPSSTSDGGWFSWQTRHSQVVTQKEEATYKLYISPYPVLLLDVFVAVLKVSGALGALAFKVGKNAYGLLRPDKFVIYYASLEDLAAGAECLRQELEGCLAQGVPFSAAITSDGLLSWGIDPPREAQTPLPLMQESWRLWITNRLARAILAARSSPTATIEPWQFALDRLQREGIDTETWSPSKTLWNEYTEGKV
jgi:hypothetical protein